MRLVKKAGKLAVRETLKQTGLTAKDLQAETVIAWTGIEEELEMIRRLMAMRIKMDLGQIQSKDRREEYAAYLDQFLAEDDDE